MQTKSYPAGGGIAELRYALQIDAGGKDSQCQHAEGDAANLEIMDSWASIVLVRPRS